MAASAACARAAPAAHMIMFSWWFLHRARRATRHWSGVGTLSRLLPCPPAIREACTRPLDAVPAHSMQPLPHHSTPHHEPKRTPLPSPVHSILPRPSRTPCLACVPMPLPPAPLPRPPLTRTRTGRTAARPPRRPGCTPRRTPPCWWRRPSCSSARRSASCRTGSWRG